MNDWGAVCVWSTVCPFSRAKVVAKCPVTLRALLSETRSVRPSISWKGSFPESVRVLMSKRQAACTCEPAVRSVTAEFLMEKVAVWFVVAAAPCVPLVMPMVKLANVGDVVVKLAGPSLTNVFVLEY